MLIRFFTIAILVMGVAGPASTANGGQNQDLQREIKPGILGRLPDILVENINFSAQAAGKMVTLTVTGTIYNKSSENSWCCPTEAGRTAWGSNASHRLLFKWKKYVRILPKLVWTEIGAGVLTMLKGNERQSFIFSDSLPSGTEREYKIVLDTEEWLKESNKDNNTKTAVFPVK
jgi:hypothetical protein